MRQEIIEQMRSELFDSQWCKNDFRKYDVLALKTDSEPFFWLVYDNGTVLSYIGPTAVKQWFSTEITRMNMFQDFYAPIQGILHYREYKKVKVFYWSGYTLSSVDFDDVVCIYENLCLKSFNEACMQFPEERDMSNELLPIILRSDTTAQRMTEALSFAKSLNDTSLNDCLSRLKRWRRIARNQKIVISIDFENYCFNFAEMVNEECHINGGIIYHKEKADNRWQIHA